MAKNKTITYTAKDIKIVETLRNFPDGLTFRELKTALDGDLATGSLTSARNKGLVDIIGGRTETETVKRKNVVYSVVSTEPQLKDDGKAWEYTDKENAILNALKNAKFENDEFTLSDLSAVMGVKLTSGNINALINKKGNLKKVGERTYTITKEKKEDSSVYGVADELPAEFINFMEAQTNQNEQGFNRNGRLKGCP